MQNWIVRVYKQDRRCKAGERFVAEYAFLAVDRAALDRELQDLTVQLYPKSQGWRFDVQERYVTVKSLMTGEPVQIQAKNQGGPCDPSTERYWSA